MSDKKIILAIDTSNYTTSVAILTLEGELIANLKRPLTVKAGERGLRQSDAVFAHTVNIPDIMEEARGYIGNKEIVAVGVSEKPRNREGSYMPCFLSGVATATSVSSAMGIPLYRFSHQCGHIMAAVYSSGNYGVLDGDFVAYHISGGTTELVTVTPTDSAFVAETVGGTADVNAGQLIDRIGVYMGLPFPSGKYIEELALKNTEKIPRKKISRKGLWLNLSGVENMATSLYDETQNKELVSAFLLDYLGRAFIELTEAMRERYGENPLVCAGGVMCNSIIKSMLSEKFEISFAEPAMSADNAVGIAALTLRAYLSEKSNGY